jgi:hypothetical protein
MPAESEYKSLAARQAQQQGYGDKGYWDYLESHAHELLQKGVTDALTRTLTDALRGNNGD